MARRLPIHFFAMFYVLGSVFWSMPSSFPLKENIMNLVGPVFKPMGLWQSWDMFSPNPRSEDAFVFARIYTEGSDDFEGFNLSKMSDMSLYERYRGERWRKFFNDYMRLDIRAKDWPQIVDGVKEIYNEHPDNQKKKISSIELWRYWRRVAPNFLKEHVEDQAWSSSRFYSLSYDTRAVMNGDLR